MGRDNHRIRDSVNVALNAEPSGPSPTAKGPGDQWPVKNRVIFDEPYEPGDGPKGPDPTQWG